MNDYAKLRNRQQEEFNALPLGFAFGDKQFEEMMKKWGLDPEKDLDKIYSIGYGGYIQRKDADLLHKTRERHDKEMQEAITADKTGEGFVYQMFLFELDNHEYGYTGDTEDTVEAVADMLGKTAEEVLADPIFEKGLQKATAKIRKREGC